MSLGSWDIDGPDEMGSDLPTVDLGTDRTVIAISANCTDKQKSNETEHEGCCFGTVSRCTPTQPTLLEHTYLIKVRRWRTGCRSEERRDGKEYTRTFRSRWSTDH